MCIKGLDSIEDCGLVVTVSAILVGFTLGCCVGVPIGLNIGWNALAISLIVTGGSILILGIAAGGTLMNRAARLKTEEKSAITNISQKHLANVSNL